MGGRISKTKAIVGGALNVGPMITMRDSELVQAGVARSHSKGVEQLYELVKGTSDIQALAIVYTTTPGEASSFKERIGSVLTEERIHIARLDPALGVHAGPGALVVALREG